MALYHKHRPQNFSSVIGQDHIVQTIFNQVANNKIAHAYLFSGPRGVGKTTLARILAKAVNCSNRQDNSSEPCNSCDSCTEISSSRSIDVMEIDAASHTGVDNVRENIIENAQFKPTKSKYKVFIIDEVHMLSTSAFNALLKTLEEPPEHVIFILATTELQKLPETIISRCQRFAFHKVPYETMKKHINSVAKEENIKIEKEVVDRIVNKSDGCVRDAISLLDQIMASGEKNITVENVSLVLPTTNIEKTLEFVSYLVKKETKPALELLSHLTDNGVNLSQFAEDVIELLRLIMVMKASGPNNELSADLSDDNKKQITKLYADIPALDLVRLIDLLLLRSAQIKTSPLPQLPLEMAVIEWCNDDTNTRINADNSNNAEDSKKINKEQAVENKIEKTEPTKTKTEEPEKKTLVEKVKDLVAKSPAFSLAEVEKNWNALLKKIEIELPSLTFILKMANLKEVDGNVLKIAVGFSFHRDKLMEKKCKDRLEKDLSGILGTKAKLEVVIEQAEQKQEKEELQNLAASLGGEIIN